MYSDLEAIWQITLTRPHVIEIKNTGGFFQDRFRVIVNGIEILNQPIFCGYGSHSFILDDSLVEIRWFVNYFSGKIDSIVLRRDEIILAQYGSDRAVGKTFISNRDRAFLSNKNNERKKEKYDSERSEIIQITRGKNASKWRTSIYIIGTTTSGKKAGLFTKAVET
ncbi:hypothetical protein NIES593_19645 [Hydrococcus rivularis NIES-593]|uniref:Uncharacterized protein n=1 Tax=Hydrococcus rivularis NIES-593 TaxID=1921803 RepID=A0A1U7H9E3_9CYAN|nr:hypothetical protein [Hydrococcus rivularis]OKH20212.1 hypothetical protein NIES593_19645 [Hydrococcus rivularis NIES-593]